MPPAAKAKDDVLLPPVTHVRRERHAKRHGRCQGPDRAAAVPVAGGVPPGGARAGPARPRSRLRGRAAAGASAASGGRGRLPRRARRPGRRRARKEEDVGNGGKGRWGTEERARVRSSKERDCNGAQAKGYLVVLGLRRHGPWVRPSRLRDRLGERRDAGRLCYLSAQPWRTRLLSGCSLSRSWATAGV